MKAGFQPGSLWIGGADNYVVEILGNGHRPGLKRVRVTEPNGQSSSEMEFVGNQIARRHTWAGEHQEALRNVLKTKENYATRVAAIRKQIEPA